MFIEPNTNIRIMHNVPLDLDRTNTVYFKNVTEQENFFNDHTKYRLMNNSYQRVKRGYIRVSINADALYDCNYLGFQNRNYGTKWFYAFITSIEYINDEVSEITFEIDQLQTWFFQIDYEPVWIDRQHTETDVIGEHTVPEPLAIGDIVTPEKIQTHLFNKYVLLLFKGARARDESISDYTGYIANMPSGVQVYVYDPDADDVLPSTSPWDFVGHGNYRTLFQDMVRLTHNEEADSVVGIVMFPKALLPSLINSTEPPYRDYTSYPSRPTNIGGYVPKNNKLLTYPYVYLEVNDGVGDSQVLKYERFTNGTPSFRIECGIGMTPEIVITPKNYLLEPINRAYSLSVKQFPQVPYTIDGYLAWTAQGGLGRTLAKAYTGGSGAYMGDQMALSSAFSKDDMQKRLVQLSGTTQALNSVAGIGMAVNDIIVARNMPGQPHGVPSGDALVANRTLDIYLSCKTITQEYARQLDDYLTRYGYQINRLAIPNISARPKWTYVKTNGFHCSGMIPASAEREIADIFDGGVTFWKDTDHVGDYTMDNSPV